MRVYLAGPMRGYADFNFPAFEAAAKRLRALGHHVFSPAQADREEGFDPARDEAKPLAHYAARDLPEICKRDAVVVLPGWEQSEGARLEVLVALALGKHIVPLVGIALSAKENGECSRL